MEVRNDIGRITFHRLRVVDTVSKDTLLSNIKDSLNIRVSDGICEVEGTILSGEVGSVHIPFMFYRESHYTCITNLITRYVSCLARAKLIKDVYLKQQISALARRRITAELANLERSISEMDNINVLAGDISFGQYVLNSHDFTISGFNNLALSIDNVKLVPALVKTGFIDLEELDYDRAEFAELREKHQLFSVSLADDVDVTLSEELMSFLVSNRFNLMSCYSSIALLNCHESLVEADYFDNAPQIIKQRLFDFAPTRYNSHALRREDLILDVGQLLETVYGYSLNVDLFSEVQTSTITGALRGTITSNNVLTMALVVRKYFSEFRTDGSTHTLESDEGNVIFSSDITLEQLRHIGELSVLATALLSGHINVQNNTIIFNAKQSIQGIAPWIHLY